MSVGKISYFVFLYTICFLLAAPKAQGAVENVKLQAIDTPTAHNPNFPIAPTRRLTFATTEGTWMSLDVSPDGRSIVFDLLGDLYLLPSEGGQAKPLTSGMAFDAQPRFSPDGTQIVFLSDRSGAENLWLVDTDGGALRQVTHGADKNFLSPDWSPDGEHIVVSARRSLATAMKPWRYSIDSGDGRQLVSEPSDRFITGLTFGADPNKLWYAFRAYWVDTFYNESFPLWQIGVLDQRTEVQHQITLNQGSAFRPVLSPDGKWLVYGTRYKTETGLRIRDLVTGEERWLAYPVQSDAQESLATMDLLPGYSFSPDSQAVIASYEGSFWRIPIDGSAITEIPFSADVDLALGPKLRFTKRIKDGPVFTAKRIRDVSFSPDGKQIAFSAVNAVWVMDYPDGVPRRLTNVERAGEGEFQPVWSPDGQWIAYVTLDDATGGHIEKVRANRISPQTPIQLTRQRALYQDPAWALDGSCLVAMRGRSINDYMPWRAIEYAWRPHPIRHFVAVSARGGEASIIREAGSMGAPHFVQGQNRIFAFGRQEGLVSFKWNGTDLKTHLPLSTVGAQSNGRSQAPVPSSVRSNTGSNHPLILASPDGRRALIYRGRELYVADLPTGTQADIEQARSSISIETIKANTTSIGYLGWIPGGSNPYWVIGNTLFVQGPQKPPLEHPIKVTVPSAMPRGRVLLRGGRIITMDADQIIEHGDILIENNRIAAVTPHGDQLINEGVTVIDVSGKTIIPGLIDVHSHPWTHDEAQQPASFLANLAYGVTTMHEVAGGDDKVIGLADKVQAGILVGPRIFDIANIGSRKVSDYETIREQLAYSRYRGQATTKMWSEMQNRQQRQWIVEAAKSLELMLTAHRGNEYDRAITNTIDGYTGHEHEIPIAPIHADVVTLMAATGITYAPTLLSTTNGPTGEAYFFMYESPAQDEKLRRFTPETRFNMFTRGGSRLHDTPWMALEEFTLVARDAEFIRDLVEAGGRAALGAHGNLQGLGAHWELWLMASGGLSNHDALRVATIFGAEAIGFGKDLGSLEPGKLADLVILDENPLEDIRNTNTIAYVMVNGRLYDGDTLDEVWPDQKKLPSYSWQADPPPNLHEAKERAQRRWPLTRH